MALFSKAAHCRVPMPILAAGTLFTNQPYIFKSPYDLRGRPFGHQVRLGTVDAGSVRNPLAKKHGQNGPSPLGNCRKAIHGRGMRANVAMPKTQLEAGSPIPIPNPKMQQQQHWLAASSVISLDWMDVSNTRKAQNRRNAFAHGAPRFAAADDHFPGQEQLARVAIAFPVRIPRFPMAMPIAMEIF